MSNMEKKWAEPTLDRFDIIRAADAANDKINEVYKTGVDSLTRSAALASLNGYVARLLSALLSKAMSEPVVLYSAKIDIPTGEHPKSEGGAA